MKVRHFGTQIYFLMIVIHNLHIILTDRLLMQIIFMIVFYLKKDANHITTFEDSKTRIGISN